MTSYIPPSQATSSGTEAYRRRFDSTVPEGLFRKAQDLQLSSIGIGTYLGVPDDATDDLYLDTITLAVRSGCNVIDTASNYRSGRSERTVGSAIRALATDGFSRDQIVVCTKAGFLCRPVRLRGCGNGEWHRYVTEKIILRGLGTMNDIVGMSHCLAPGFLANQVENSLARLKAESVDVFYLHNPEVQRIGRSEGEFDLVMRSAFEKLEELKARSLVKFYGIASWKGFREHAGSPAYHSIERLESLAREVGGQDHGFRFAQLPFSIAMPEALSSQNQSIGNTRYSFLQAASQLGISVVTSAPLSHGTLPLRIAAAEPDRFADVAAAAASAIRFATSAPGVTTTLIGMSGRLHVAENLRRFRNVRREEPPVLVPVLRNSHRPD